MDAGGLVDTLPRSSLSHNVGEEDEEDTPPQVGYEEKEEGGIRDRVKGDGTCQLQAQRQEEE